MPADAQKSPDGNYWWDGAQWQPVDQSQSGQAQGAGQSGGADGQAQTVAMTDDHFANMLAAAEQSVTEA
jgi:hypothetical protein